MVTFHLYLQNGLKQPFLWWVTADDGRTVASGETDWSKLAELAEQWERPTCIVWLDGRLVRFVRAKVPARNRQQLRRAFPYAVEDWFAEDVEQLHFALSEPDDDGVVSALVVREDVMRTLADHFRELNWAPTLVTADYSALSGGADVVRHPEKILLHLMGNAPEHDAVGGFEPSIGDAALALWRSNHDDIAPNLRVIGESAEEGASQNADWSQVLKKPAVGAINLLQGRHIIRAERHGALKMLRPLLASVTAVIILLVALGTIKWIDLSQRVKQLTEAQRIVFQKAFPGVRVRNPYRQMRAMARNQGDPSQGDFLTLLAVFHKVYASTKDVEVTSVQYRAKRNELQVDLVAPDYQTFEQLKTALARQGMQVKPISANRNGERYVGRLMFSGASS